MSSCLILQEKNRLFIGADTSASVFNHDKLFRLHNHNNKLFKLNKNTIMYCAGNNEVSQVVQKHIQDTYNYGDFYFEELQKWLVKNFPLKENKGKTIYDTEILICTMKNDATIVYQMSQYNNYQLVVHNGTDNGIKILSAGIKNQDSISYAEREILKHLDVKNIYRKVFEKLSCNYIGGNLDVYCVENNKLNNILFKERIIETNIDYINKYDSSLIFSLNAEVVMGKLVMSEYLHVENESGTYKFDDDGFIASSTNNKNQIKIQPSNDGELFSIYKGNSKQFYVDSDGNVIFAGDLSGANGTFTGVLKGGSIDIGDGNFTVDKNGNMIAKNGTFGGTLKGVDGEFTGDLKGSNIYGSTIEGGTIRGTNITGANGNFTEGFSVSCPIDDFYLSSDLIIKGDSSGIKFGYNNMYGFYGMELFKSGINLSTSGGKNFSLDQVTINGSSLRNLITQNILSDYVVSSQNVSAKYTQATGSYGTGGDLIMFDNASSGKKTGATAGYVQTYVRDYVGAKLPHEYVSGITSDSWSTVESNTWVITSVSISEASYTSSSDSIASTRSRLFLSGSKIKKNLSDKRLKENIKDLDDKFIQLYDKLNPKQFSFHDDIPTTKGKHFGLIAQDVMSAIDECGIDNSNLRLVWRNKVDEEANEDKYINDYTLQMDYDELHALHIKYSQHLNDKIDMLEKRVAELEKNNQKGVKNERIKRIKGQKIR